MPSCSFASTPSPPTGWRHRHVSSMLCRSHMYWWGTKLLVDGAFLRCGRFFWQFCAHSDPLRAELYPRRPAAPKSFFSPLRRGLRANPPLSPASTAREILPQSSCSLPLDSSDLFLEPTKPRSVPLLILPLPISLPPLYSYPYDS